MPPAFDRPCLAHSPARAKRRTRGQPPRPDTPRPSLLSSSSVSVHTLHVQRFLPFSYCSAVLKAYPKSCLVDFSLPCCARLPTWPGQESAAKQLQEKRP